MAADEAHLTSGLQDTLVAVWQGEPTVARVTALGEELGVMAQNHGRSFLYNVITVSTPMPSAEAREALRAGFESRRGQLVAAAIVLEKIGVEGMLSRTVLSTLLTIAQRPFAMKVFFARRDGALWLANQGCRPSATTLIAKADALAERLLSGAPPGVDPPRPSRAPR